MVFVKNMHSSHIIQSSRKQTLAEVEASFPVTISVFNWSQENFISCSSMS